MRIIALLSCVFLFGCANKVNPAFYDVVISHNQLTTETNNAIIKSIQEDLSTNNYNQEQESSARNLIERLDFIIKQSEVMSDYIKNQSDSDTISKLIQLRWHNQEKE